MELALLVGSRNHCVAGNMGSSAGSNWIRAIPTGSEWRNSEQHAEWFWTVVGLCR